ncbi:MAG: FdtA/QdtA family cupin domain-containing protein [Rhodobiaceae bacterium]|nr:FdtA/QdtA family cupin domain-containing protein [Rhodobiaceae bacterium]MCC0018181.1 FdtA/QdtA family cupin domain-containing protein [Rhodobiaceae bacterium]MCC0051253.1 FdtA/QdtA family cupin domain-containing protein [Rhodobiaceae bacterium]MCC0053082.1 FdtA/QdtA family cupin domain-containing protein [Rhodobiaceae bacterium]
MTVRIVDEFLDSLVRTLDFPVYEDARGALMPLAWPDVPFVPAHAFIVRARDGALRGGHGHRKAAQLLVRIGGKIVIEARNRGVKATIELAGSPNAILVRPPVWWTQTYHGADAAALVLSNLPYDLDAYIKEPDA